MTQPRYVVLWGGTGQAIVVKPVIDSMGSRVIAVVDEKINQSPFKNVSLLNGMLALRAFIHEYPVDELLPLGFVITIGNPHAERRIELHEELKALGLTPLDIIHKTAFIDDGAKIGEGAQILAHTFIGARARLGKCCILNTKSSIDHETVLEDGVELGPGAITCGSVHVKKYSWLCAGSVVLPWKTIGSRVTIGAGAVVTRDVPDGVTMVGVPATKRIK